MVLLQLAAEVFNTGQALVAALPPLPLLPHPLPLEIVVAQNNFFKKKIGCVFSSSVDSIELEILTTEHLKILFLGGGEATNFSS